MGVNSTSFTKLNTVIDTYFTDSSDKVLLELGLQETWGTMEFRYVRDVLQSKFAAYISIDLHKIKGTTLFDLSEFSPNYFKADLITNFGTAEHVELEQGQYNCWANIHNWLNLNGIVIHEVPMVGHWQNHCRYFYDYNFFKTFEKYGYEILELEINTSWGEPLVWCILKKIKNVDFMLFEEFKNIMFFDSKINSNNVALHNNPKRLNF